MSLRVLTTVHDPTPSGHRDPHTRVRSYIHPHHLHTCVRSYVRSHRHVLLLAAHRPLPPLLCCTGTPPTGLCWVFTFDPELSLPWARTTSHRTRAIRPLTVRESSPSRQGFLPGPQGSPGAPGAQIPRPQGTGFPVPRDPFRDVTIPRPTGSRPTSPWVTSGLYYNTSCRDVRIHALALLPRTRFLFLGVTIPRATG